MTHHIMEANFKALDQATMLEERLAGKVLSTKGML
jgi:imidazoleglycerol-phosphate dehydratase